MTLLNASAALYSLTIGHTATRIKTGFRGCINNITTIEALYTKFIEEKNWLTCLPVYRLSQDHIEIFFGKIRSMHGCNDNPTVQQFTSSYRWLYFQQDFSISDRSNIASQSFSNILQISSSSRYQNRPSTYDIEDRSNQKFEDSVMEGLIGNNRFNRIDYANDVGLSFVAGIIEKRVLASGVTCEPCHRAIEKNEKVDDDVCMSASQYKTCRSTLQIWQNWQWRFGTLRRNQISQHN